MSSQSRKVKEMRIFLKVFSENLEYSESRELIAKVIRAKNRAERLWLEKNILAIAANYIKKRKKLENHS